MEAGRLTINNNELFLGFPSISIVWIGPAYEHLYAVLSNGKTYRLDKNLETKERYWSEVAQLPML